MKDLPVNDGATYAPQSPDLSFLDNHDNEPYRPRSPFIPPLQQQYTPYNQYETAYPPIPQLPAAHSQFQQPAIHSPTSQYHPSFMQNQSPSAYHQPLPASSTAYQQPQSNPIPIKRENRSKQPAGTHDAYPTPDNSFPSYASTTGKTMAQQAAGSSRGNGLGPSQGIEIKTKFPVARIKRIMQADEEVGKVAQVTPVAVSKALELFMISLCTKSADIARNGNSKRITASHLKAAIEKDEQYDFLTEIVSKVADPAEAGGGDGGGEKKRGRAKAEAKSEGDSDEAEKKVKSTRGRKKKVEVD